MANVRNLTSRNKREGIYMKRVKRYMYFDEIRIRLIGSRHLRSGPKLRKINGMWFDEATTTKA